MKHYFLLFFLSSLLFSCKKEPSKSAVKWEIISKNVQYQIKPDVFRLKSGKFIYDIESRKLPYNKVILLNASLVGYFTELGLEDKIIGISSPEYVFSPKVQQHLKLGKIKDIGNEQKYDVEKIIALKPDVIFTNYVASFENTYDVITKNGIEIIFMDEYLEQNPLEKSKYLLVFGKLLGADQKAKERFHTIKNSYDSLKIVAKKSSVLPIVLANEMYGNQWFLPGGKSNLAQLLSDANAVYINEKSPETKAVPMSFEEVFAKSQKAQFWVNVGNHREKKELLQINPNYAKMKVFNDGKLYTVSVKEKISANDYFESGVVRADLILKDYIKIFHPELLPSYNLTYLKELKYYG